MNVLILALCICIITIYVMNTSEQFHYDSSHIIGRTIEYMNWGYCYKSLYPLIVQP